MTQEDNAATVQPNEASLEGEIETLAEALAKFDARAAEGDREHTKAIGRIVAEHGADLAWRLIGAAIYRIGRHIPDGPGKRSKMFRIQSLFRSCSSLDIHPVAGGTGASLAPGEDLEAPEGCVIIEPIDGPAMMERYASTPEEAKANNKILIDGKTQRLLTRNIGWITSVGPGYRNDTGIRNDPPFGTGDWVAWNADRQIELPMAVNARERRIRLLVPTASVLTVFSDVAPYVDDEGPRVAQVPAPRKVALPGPGDIETLSLAGRLNDRAGTIRG